MGSLSVLSDPLFGVLLMTRAPGLLCPVDFLPSFLSVVSPCFLRITREFVCRAAFPHSIFPSNDPLRLPSACPPPAGSYPLPGSSAFPVAVPPADPSLIIRSAPDRSRLLRHRLLVFCRETYTPPARVSRPLLCYYLLYLSLVRMEDVRVRLPVLLPLLQHSFSSSSSSSSDEPLSPDSGFSSDDSTSLFTSPLQRQRSDRLRSALRRLPSGGKKRVRFADAVIHQLVSDCEDEPEPVIVKPALRRPQQFAVSLPNFIFCSESEYFHKARCGGVAVAALRPCGHSVIVQVAVHNLAFDKEIVLRLSGDSWSSSTDLVADYSHSASGAGDIDIFSASLNLPSQEGLFDLCVRYKAGGKEFWDNNEGGNYRIVWAQK